MKNVCRPVLSGIMRTELNHPAGNPTIRKYLTVKNSNGKLLAVSVSFEVSVLSFCAPRSAT